MSLENSSQVLLDRFRAGDSRAAGEVFDRYVTRLLGLIRKRISPRLQQRVDADDVVQSAMRSFFARAANDDYVLQRAGDLWRLLAAIALNKLRRQVEVHSAARRDIGHELHVGDRAGHLLAVANRSPQPDEEVALLEVLEQALAAVSPDQREALQLRLQGETIERIAQLMGRSQRTVRRLLQTSQQVLEQWLREER